MIKFDKLNNEEPYAVFKKKYDISIDLGQKNIEAVCISSFSKNINEVNSRFVNLKYIINDKFIFFSNYNSQKAQDFESHRQISAALYWDVSNIQIRMKATVKKTSKVFNNNYFKKRDLKKNALAISSIQSATIKSYADAEKKYKKSLKNDRLDKCPDYWGGYSFTPYYFEFWDGHESRLNRREVYELDIKGLWRHKILQP